MLHKPKAETEVTTHRIESFSDGVFAIAITLLVLEIKVPHLEDGRARDLSVTRTCTILLLYALGVFGALAQEAETPSGDQLDFSAFGEHEFASAPPPRRPLAIMITAANSDTPVTTGLLLTRVALVIVLIVKPKGNVTVHD